MTLRVELKSAGVAQLLKSAEMVAEMRIHADRIAARAGDGFGVEAMVGRNRARATVRAETPEARRRQAKDHVLERSI